MSFNVNLPMGRSNSMSGLTGMRLTSKDPQSVSQVFYDSINRVTEATYTLVDGTTETVSLTYTIDGWLEHNSIEYRDYQYDLFAAAIVPKDASQSTEGVTYQNSREDLLIETQNEIIKQLKLMNVHLSIISDETIEEYEY